MELFQENKNLLFQATVDLINDMVEQNKKYSEKEVRDYLAGIIDGDCAKEVRGSLEDKINDLLYGRINEEEYGMNSSPIQKNGDSCYEPKVKKEIPYIPSKMERYVLAELAQDPIAKKLLSDGTLEKIYKHVDGETAPERYLYKNQRDSRRQYEEQCGLNYTIRMLMKAMIEEKMIKYDNQTRNGLLEGKIGTPYKFVYSSRLNRIQLIIKPEGEERGVLVNVWGLRNIQILDIKADKELKQWFEKQKSEFTLKIVNKEEQTKEKKVNVVERCFSLFSHLDKEAVYNEKEDTHTIKIRYYNFDEEDIVRDILSMGSDVVVLEPQKLREKIIANIT